MKYNLLHKEEQYSPIVDVLKKEYCLTNQQALIAGFFFLGKTRIEICQNLDISQNTLKNHLKLIYKKTINQKMKEQDSIGRVDKLSQLIHFLYKLESSTFGS